MKDVLKEALGEIMERLSEFNSDAEVYFGADYMQDGEVLELI